jgi:2-dehydro-3-deoxygluconokinase
MSAVRTACFGELLIRLAVPDKQLLAQADTLDLYVAGAEANVAIGLASLGGSCRMISVVPGNALGRRAVAALSATGVDCSSVQVKAGRMGLYFLTPGAGPRAAEIIYDREGSVFARALVADFDWDAAFSGMDRLHISGINPALGPESARTALTAVKAAKARGMVVSFDGNFRANLWAAWESDPRSILRDMIVHADIFFGNHRDVGLLLGVDFGATDGEKRRRAAAEAAFKAFPNLKIIASTARHVIASEQHELSARVDTPDDCAQTRDVMLSTIVDRIGAGDAFAAGILHGLDAGLGLDHAAYQGLALTCLKHALPGDASLFTQDDIDSFLNGDLDVRR